MCGSSSSLKLDREEEAVFSFYHTDTFVSSKRPSSLVQSKKLKTAPPPLHAGQVTNHGTVDPSIASQLETIYGVNEKRDDSREVIPGPARGASRLVISSNRSKRHSPVGMKAPTTPCTPRLKPGKQRMTRTDQSQSSDLHLPPSSSFVNHCMTMQAVPSLQISEVELMTAIQQTIYPSGSTPPLQGGPSVSSSLDLQYSFPRHFESASTSSISGLLSSTSYSQASCPLRTIPKLTRWSPRREVDGSAPFIFDPEYEAHIARRLHDALYRLRYEQQQPFAHLQISSSSSTLYSQFN